MSPQEEEVPHRPPKGQGTTSWFGFVVSLVSLSSFFGNLDCMLAFQKASAMHFAWFLVLSLSSCAAALSRTRCDTFVLLRSGVVSAWWCDERRAMSEPL